MPTLAVPTRRPFTEQGKALGRLKLLVAGDTGIGKSSLIRAIIQRCYNTTNDSIVAETSHYIDQHLRRSMMSGLDESNAAAFHPAI
ncbi:hypothetical protein HYQ44_000272 [Verticillium longisporum]|nr:hypothetical protein HYQ44_000272 [Verticillium longisporum]